MKLFCESHILQGIILIIILGLAKICLSTIYWSKKRYAWLSPLQSGQCIKVLGRGGAVIDAIVLVNDPQAKKIILAFSGDEDDTMYDYSDSTFHAFPTMNSAHYETTALSDREQLERELWSAIDSENYKRAAMLRDAIKALAENKS